MSLEEIQTQGNSLRALVSRSSQAYTSNDPKDPIWLLPIISLKQQIYS